VLLRQYYAGSSSGGIQEVIRNLVKSVVPIADHGRTAEFLLLHYTVPTTTTGQHPPIPACPPVEPNFSRISECPFFISGRAFPTQWRSRETCQVDNKAASTPYIHIGCQCQDKWCLSDFSFGQETEAYCRYGTGYGKSAAWGHGSHTPFAPSTNRLSPEIFVPKYMHTHRCVYSA